MNARGPMTLVEILIYIVFIAIVHAIVAPSLPPIDWPVLLGYLGGAGALVAFFLWAYRQGQR